MLASWAVPKGPTLDPKAPCWPTGCGRGGQAGTDQAIDQLRGAGVPVLQEPADQPWGERMATVTDPDGNRVIIATRAPAGRRVKYPGGG